ncbi:MAG: helicase-associated domain-containing protein, partial [Anaerolineales bacterium]|nr:helicase-associated domain-containing protein [Anaerolineales bacterium]MDW8226243.1 helicase-associated domain-containing protein [Anaerolineales bacterium]
LQRARAQGLKVNTLLALLAKHASAELPPSLVKAIRRWEQRGNEARLERRLILRLSRPEVLDELRRSQAGRYLGEVLGPTAVVVKEGAAAQIFSALTSLGLLAEDATESDIIVREDNHK